MNIISLHKRLHTLVKLLVWVAAFALVCPASAFAEQPVLKNLEDVRKAEAQAEAAARSKQVNVENALEAVTAARQELEAAVFSGDRETMEQARETLDQATKNAEGVIAETASVTANDVALFHSADIKLRDIAENLGVQGSKKSYISARNVKSGGATDHWITVEKDICGAVGLGRSIEVPSGRLDTVSEYDDDDRNDRDDDDGDDRDDDDDDGDDDDDDGDDRDDDDDNDGDGDNGDNDDDDDGNDSNDDDDNDNDGDDDDDD